MKRKGTVTAIAATLVAVLVVGLIEIELEDRQGLRDARAVCSAISPGMPLSEIRAVAATTPGNPKLVPQGSMIKLSFGLCSCFVTLVDEKAGDRKESLCMK